MADKRRFEDNGVSVASFDGDILVVCPVCGERALVTRNATTERWRLTCSCCGHSADPPSSQARNEVVWGAMWARMGSEPRFPWADGALARLSPVQFGRLARSVLAGPSQDPHFGLPLWLQTPCCGDTLWAYNLAHLEFLDSLVGAELRGRGALGGRSGWRNGSLASRLPRWLKAAKNRDEVLRGIAKLRELAC
jgi:hypothetical protein